MDPSREPLTEADVRAACETFKAEGVDTLAISFVWSVLRPEHERRATEIVLTRRNRVRRTDPRTPGDAEHAGARRAVSGSAGRAAAGAVAGGGAAVAHHSTAAEFDSTKPITFTGTPNRASA